MKEVVGGAFRQAFRLPGKNVNWYPGHMRKGMSDMQRKLISVDCVIEVHDARIPLSGRNPAFVKKLLGAKPHILVLNKKDLIAKSEIKKIKSKLTENGTENVIFTNCLIPEKCSGVRRLVPAAVDLISNCDRYNRSEEPDLSVMVIGIPNVGKSSIINALRSKNLSRGKGTAVGAVAGITRSVLTRIKVNVSPDVYLIDTPGILPPNISDVEVGMKLALCSCLKDSVIGEPLIADFLLYWLNKCGNFKYVEEFKLDGPTDNILPVLEKIAVDNNKYLKLKDMATNSIVVKPNITHSAQVMISRFRTGKFGLINLDGHHFSQ